jgi:hypothetical protein
MKIFNKLALVATMAAGIGLTSCQGEEFIYEVGAPAAQDSAVVYFASDLSNVVLQISDSTISIDVARYATEAATYKLDVTFEDGTNGAITVPSSVTFEEGVLATTFDVHVGAIELMKNYTVKIAIDEAWVNPYAAGDNTVLSFNVMREDFAPYAEGTYVDYFLYTDADGNPQPYGQVLEYSPSTEVYRIQDCWGMGAAPLTFTWDGGENITLGVAALQTGYNHSKYGMVTANYLGAEVMTQDNLVQFVFYIKWTVSAGSFGEYPNLFVFERPAE